MGKNKVSVVRAVIKMASVRQQAPFGTILPSPTYGDAFNAKPLIIGRLNSSPNHRYFENSK